MARPKETVQAGTHFGPLGRKSSPKSLLLPISFLRPIGALASGEELVSAAALMMT